MGKPKILILTTTYGNGHLQVARALEERFMLKNCADVVVRDIYQETNPRLYEWTKKLYLKSYTKGGRQLYRIFYYSSQGISKRNRFPIFSYGNTKLRKIITEVKPDAIINTFPSLTISQYLLHSNATVPVYNVVTDYCLHHSWVHPGITKYYVATHHLKSNLIGNGISSNRIAVTGIPVQNQFEQPLCRQALIKKYQLHSDRKIVLIVAGAYGVSTEIKVVCEGLMKDDQLQILIVCGKNYQLYEQLQSKYHSNKQVRVFGYMTQMAELFELATCVITKPGGIILSEAVVKNVPIILPRPTPGQERENALFFQQHRAAVCYEKPERIVEETQKLIYDDRKLTDMTNALKSLHTPNSADIIINDVLETYYWHFSQNKMVKRV